MAYSAAAVANAFIRIAATEKGMTLTNLKLQKLIYFAHGWYLALANEPLIHEQIQSWKLGPVVNELYQHLREYRSEYVAQQISTFDAIRPDSPDFEFLTSIFNKYGCYSPAELVAMTHAPGSPWEQFGAGQYSYHAIDNESIKQYFLGLQKRNTLF